MELPWIVPNNCQSLGLPDLMVPPNGPSSPRHWIPRCSSKPGKPQQMTGLQALQVPPKSPNNTDCPYKGCNNTDKTRKIVLRNIVQCNTSPNENDCTAKIALTKLAQRRNANHNSHHQRLAQPSLHLAWIPSESIAYCRPPLTNYLPKETKRLDSGARNLFLQPNKRGDV